MRSNASKGFIDRGSVVRKLVDLGQRFLLCLGFGNLFYDGIARLSALFRRVDFGKSRRGSGTAGC